MTAEALKRPTIDVTEGDEVSGKVLRFRGPEPNQRAEAREDAPAGARARLAVTERAGKRASTAVREWAAQVSTAAATRSVWSDPPESLAEHAGYVKSHPWSADFPLAIVAGCLYGWLAFLASVPLLTAVWLLRRPSRLFLATLVALVVWLTV